MTWDIQPGKESEYMEFITQEFAPGIMKLGIQPTEAWYTVAGNGPQILAGGVSENRESMLEILGTDEWLDLEKRLLTFVTDFRYKIVAASGNFQL